MEVSVKSDFMAPAADFLYHQGIMFSNNAGNEKGCLYSIHIQHVQDSGYALLGAVCAPG